MFKKLVHILGILHIVVALNCMLIGVIVEFHQVHVYKNNISFWHLMATKTAHKDSKKFVKPVPQIVKSMNADGLAQDLHYRIDVLLFQRWVTNIYSRHLVDLKSSEYIYDKVLRGPPIV
jgi:hypothetical protein